MAKVTYRADAHFDIETSILISKDDLNDEAKILSAIVSDLVDRRYLDYEVLEVEKD